MELHQFAPIIARIKNLAPEAVRISPNLDLIEGMGFDSLDVTELLYSIEDTIGVNVNYEKLRPAHLRSLEALREFLVTECSSG